MTRSYLWHLLLGDAASTATLEQRLTAIYAGWESGDLTSNDVLELCFDAAVYDSIPETLSKLDPVWSGDLFRLLQGWALADATERPFRVFGGIYSYEVEPDPEKAAQMRLELETRHRAEDDHFTTELRPFQV